MPFIKAGRHNIEFGNRTLIMGIINVTPDSFSDGGLFYNTEHAVNQARRLVESGADILDIGGESSRPGSVYVEADEEIRRIIPVIRKLTEYFPQIPLSIDTWKHEVAAAALAAGASIINDIYGFQADAGLPGVCSEYDAGVILMHNAVIYRLRHPAAKAFDSSFRLDQNAADELNKMTLSGSIKAQLAKSLSIADRAGISRNRIILDPGIGFGLTTDESIQLIKDLNILKEYNLPILLAPSRKRFIGDVLGVPVDQRQEGTAAAAAAGIWCGADIIRVHDVEQVLQTVRMTDAIQKAGFGVTGIIGHNSPEHGTMSFADNQLTAQLQDKQSGRILMNGMKFHGHVGVLDAEKTLGQDFTVDLVLELKSDEAFFSDNLADTLNYAEIFEMVKGIVGTVNFELIERLAGYIAEQLIVEYPGLLAAVEVTVGKPQAPIAGDFDTMAVRIRRTGSTG
jgi:dihydropteroate synthase